MFKVGQHLRDAILLNKLCEQLGCGKFREDSKNLMCAVTVTKLSDILAIIIPLFNHYNLQGSKSLDFKNFIRIAELVKNKVHLTNDGLQTILNLKTQMRDYKNNNMK
nr:LAGLIDADG endonuclease [Orbilia oligospora]QBL02009.1 LAGLIDADG endonuclease [Orbilia oligospora]